MKGPAWEPGGKRGGFAHSIRGDAARVSLFAGVTL
jgi:hypothetical protein